MRHKHRWGGIRISCSDGTTFHTCEDCRAFGKRLGGEGRIRFWMTKAAYWDKGGVDAFLAGQAVTAPNRCVHSLLKCGECRAGEAEEMATIAELEAKIEQYKKELADAKAPAAPASLKLDLGCGTKKQPGFHGVDSIAFPGVDTVCDLAASMWPWADSSVDEVHCAQALEHIPTKEIDYILSAGTLSKYIRYPRAHFFNELWRVLKPGAKATIIVPYWCSGRYYGDPTHEWAPVSEWTWPYLDKQWRTTEAPATLTIYSCDFTTGYGYNLSPHLHGRNEEFRNTAIRDNKEAAQDMIATLVARK